ncbi:unnamed protein product [Peronospora destructor]|uniref:Uncharacterized protein n=1 Tax=Peronospora destructor TaxID=86335 RepID=A0AAV0SZA0_9STRA|nr:unnamed protein product [Peronospora destructor]
MLTREQTARQQQRMTQETLMRAYSEEHTECLKAASRRIGALEGRFTRSEAERTLLHEKLMARETELYMHKHSLEAAISSLSERAQAIESSHMQHSNMQEGDNSPRRLLGHLDDKEKIRAMQSEIEVLEAQLQIMAEKLKRVEG